MPDKRTAGGEPIVIGKHEINVVEIDGRERLFIDGIQRRYIRAEAGYILREAIYAPPEPTLLDAARRYVELLARIEAARDQQEED